MSAKILQTGPCLYMPDLHLEDYGAELPARKSNLSGSTSLSAGGL